MTPAGATGQAQTATSLAEKCRRRWSEPNLRHVDVALIGTWPENRGGLGVSPFHVHEARDC